MANSTGIQIPCTAVQGKLVHDIVEYNLDPSDSIYTAALLKAPNLIKQLNPNGPNGQLRSDELRKTVAFSGTVAELLVLDYLNKQFSLLNPPGDLIASSVPGVIRDKNNFNQIDIRVSRKSSGKSVTIEVRSSNTYKKNTQQMYNVDQSLVGWYVTKFKSSENKKDYYIMLYFRHSVEEVQYRMENRQPLTVHIAAGVSKDFLEKYGVDSSLKQGSSAEFRIIKPIVGANSVENLVHEINRFL